MATLHSRWITKLHVSFQDEHSLYLVMEYLPGGNLATLMLRADEGQFNMDEDAVSFYIAETLLALGNLHELGYVHRYLEVSNYIVGYHVHIC